MNFFTYRLAYRRDQAITTRSRVLTLLTMLALTAFAALPLKAQNVPAISVTLLPAAPYYSDTVTVTTRLTGPAGTPQPTGTISYTVDTGSASTATLTAGTTASLAYLQINPLVPGVHTLTFYYSGDGNYASTKTTPQVQTFTVADLPLAFVSGTYYLNPYLSDQMNKSGFVGDFYASGVAVDPLGNVFLSSGNANGGTPGITKIGTNQILSTVPVSGIGASTKLATDTAGNLYIADPSNGRIVVYSTAGVQTVLPATGLMTPAAIMFDAANNSLVILDTAAGDIVNFNLTTSAQTTLQSGLTQLSAMVATNGKGDLFYVQNKVVMESIPGSTPVPIFGEFSNPDPNINAYPSALAFNEVTGDLFVAQNYGSTQLVSRIDKLHHTIFVGRTQNAQLSLDSQGELDGTDTVISTGAAADSGPGIFDASQGLGGSAQPDTIFAVPYGHSVPGTYNSSGYPGARGAVNDGGAGVGVPVVGTINYSIKVTTDNGLTVTVPSYGIGFGPFLAVDPGIVTVTPATFSNIGGVTYLEQQASYDTLYVSDKAQNTVSSIIFDLNDNGRYPNPYKTLDFQGLKGPTQLAVDGAFDVYVLDSGALNGGSRIVRLDYANNQTIPYTADTGDAAGLLGSLTCFTIDGATNLYLGGTDKNGKGVIVRQDAFGYESKRITTPNAPTLIAIDALHTLFFTDTQGNLLRVDQAGNLTTLATGLAPSTSLSLDPSDTVYLTSASAQTITTVSATGVVGQLTVPGSTHPALAVAEDLGSLYVADSSLQQVIVDTRYSGSTLGENINFGTVAIGSTATQNETLRNTGNLSLVPFTFTAPAPFSIAPGATNGCQDTTGTNPTVLAPAGSCSMQLQYAPTKAATDKGNADIRVTSDLVYGYFGLVDVNWNLSGVASTAALSIAPTTITFPSTAVGATSAPLTSTLTNGGTSSLYITAGSLADSTDFTQSNNCNGIIAPGASCTITFTFTPKSAAALTSTYTVADLNNPSNTLTVALSGTGIGAVMIAPTTQVFPDTAVGSTSAVQTSVLTNTTASAVTLHAGSLTDANDFTQSDNCSGQVAAGSSCAITFAFTPKSSGALSSTYSISTGSQGWTVALSGNGTAARVPQAVLSPTSLTFTTVVNTAAYNQTVTLSNPGDVALTISSFAISGANASSFQIVTNTCGTSLAANASCSITVGFPVIVAGTYTATLTVTDNASPATQIVALTGTVTGTPQATLTPAALSFTTTVGTSAATQIETLTNSGTAALTISLAVLGGSNASAFAIASSTCGTTLAAGASCTFTLGMSATAVGSYSAGLNVTDNANPSTQIVGLTGQVNGVAAAALTPATASFGSVNTGSTSAAQTFTLANAGSAALTITSVSVSGPNAAMFAVTAKTCGATLAAGASCTVTIAFSPTSAGNLTATLSVVDAVGTQTSPLSGVGVSITPPDFSITATPAAQSTYRGASVSYTIQLASLVAGNPFSNAVTLAASGLPAGATATFSPATVTPGTAPQTATMTVAVPALVGKAVPGRRGVPEGITLAMVALGLLVGGRARRRMPRLLSMLLLAGLAGLSFTMTGCGAGTGFDIPASTSTISVMATGGGTTHSTTVTLTIQ
jgi:sugar lactone lactonase YvrE